MEQPSFTCAHCNFKFTVPAGLSHFYCLQCGVASAVDPPNTHNASHHQQGVNLERSSPALPPPGNAFPGGVPATPLPPQPRRRQSNGVQFARATPPPPEQYHILDDDVVSQWEQLTAMAPPSPRRRTEPNNRGFLSYTAVPTAPPRPPQWSPGATPATPQQPFPSHSGRARKVPKKSAGRSPQVPFIYVPEEGEGMKEARFRSFGGRTGFRFSAPPNIPHPEGNFRRSGRGRRKSSGSSPGAFPDEEFQYDEGNDEGAAVEHEEDDQLAGTAAETFTDYRPAKVFIGPPHPDPIVETSSLSAVQPPEPTYSLAITKHLEDTNKLSCLQIESLVYANQRHLQYLPTDERAGFFIGDGAGVGKGRTIAGLIWENWHHLRRKSLWISVGSDLKVDARRDLDDVGASCVPLHPLNKLPYSKLDSVGIREGVVFSTYTSLIASSGINSRLQQLVEWCGPDFDGLIVFDECHKAKNLVQRGGKQATKTGEAVLEIQAQLPQARVVYCSATGASEPRNMAYMVRLGLWGTGTSFCDFGDFLTAMENGGVGALELVAMDLKARGMYVCRTLSHRGAEFEVVEVPLEEKVTEAYRKAAEFWVKLRMKLMEAEASKDDVSNARQLWSLYWSSHQRFFRHILMSAKVPTVVRIAKQALMVGKCVVIGLQSTGEARTEGAVAKYGAELDDFISGPRELLLKFVEEYCPEEDILEEIRSLDLPNNPLDDIIDQLGGPDFVAEITGRRGMLVRDGSGTRVNYQARNMDVAMDMVNINEKKLFMNGEKLVAIISEAGSAGVSLQADKRALNQKRRVHMTLELPWSADRAIQQFGRTHRSNQVSAPQYKLLFTDVGGERRFASRVAKRLESLGALTQGDRRAGAGKPSLSAYNYDSIYGKKALEKMYKGILGQELLPVEIPDLHEPDSLQDFLVQMKDALVSVGIVSEDSDKIKDKDIRDVARFLNRLLGLAPEMQNRMFKLFIRIFDLLIDTARGAGNLESPIVDMKAKGVELNEKPKTVHVDAISGAATLLFTFTFDRGFTWESASALLQEVRQGIEEIGFYKSKRQWMGKSHFLLALNGSSANAFKIIRPAVGECLREMPTSELKEKYSKVSSMESSRAGWEDEYDVSSRQCMHGVNCRTGKNCTVGRRLTKVNVLGGLVFPVWGTISNALSRLARKSDKRIRIVRIETTAEASQRIVGLLIPNAAVESVLRNLSWVQDIDD